MSEPPTPPTTPNPTPSPAPAPGNLVTPITQEMQESYLTYAMSVIMARALPDVRDGLKPSQRRILVAMHDLNLRPGSKHRKCAKICGDTSGNYHPHGEGVIYPTLVRMAQHWAMRHLLVDPQGNFGSIDGDPPAAMRYTEARLAHPAADMLADIDQETVDFEPNYDGTLKEPVVLPSKFPNLLVNGSEGIAVGMATRLLPHNLSEICDAIIAVIDKPDIATEELMRYVLGPDLPTGGVIHGRQGIFDAFDTGKGSIVVRGKMHVEQLKNGREQIVVDEIPYGVLLPTIKERINDAVESGNIKGIDDMRDESGRQSLVRLVITLKKDVNPDVVINQLWQFTPLQSNLHMLNIVLVNRVPRQLGLRALIQAFIDHRAEVIRRRTQYLLRKARQRAHILEGLLLAVCSIDEVIKIIRSSQNVEEARQRLMTEVRIYLMPESVDRLEGRAADYVRGLEVSQRGLTRTQADAILSMQLRKLTGLEIFELGAEYNKLCDEIADYEMILSDHRLVLDIIAEDMRELKERYGEPRRTLIEAAVDDIHMDQLIAQEQVIVSISHMGYVKRVPLDTFRGQGRGGKGVKGTDAKDEDFIEHLRVASTHDYMLFFTNRGRVYWLRVYDLPSMGRTSRGRSLANLLTMQTNERHVAILPVSAFEEKFVFFCTEKGVVKKTPLSAFSNPRPSGIQAVTLDPDDSLIGVGLTDGQQEIVIGTRMGMACRFNEDDVRAMGRTARGVRGIDLAADDKVVDLVVISPGMSLLTVCEKGMGKKTDIDEYRLTKRGAKGVINVRVTEKNGPVVALRAVTSDDELMLITGKGVLLRMSLDQLRDIGRATQGVKLIRVEEDDTVVAVAKLISEKDEEAAATGQPPEVPPEAGRAEAKPAGKDEPLESDDAAADEDGGEPPAGE